MRELKIIVSVILILAIQWMFHGFLAGNQKHNSYYFDFTKLYIQ